MARATFANVMHASADYKVTCQVEQLATDANWQIVPPNILRKEYAFMTSDRATAFANRVTALLRQHWAFGSVQRTADQVTVQIRSRDPGALAHEDAEFALTVEALRTMSASPRESAERASE